MVTLEEIAQDCCTSSETESKEEVTFHYVQLNTYVIHMLGWFALRNVNVESM